MSYKQIVKINEHQLKQIVAESVKHVLKEIRYNGRSYSGNSPKDWADLRRIRIEKSSDSLSNSDISGFQKHFSKAISNHEKVEQTLRKLFLQASNVKTSKEDGRLKKAKYYYDMLHDSNIESNAERYMAMVHTVEMFLTDIIDHPILDFDGINDDYDDNDYSNDDYSNDDYSYEDDSYDDDDELDRMYKEYDKCYDDVYKKLESYNGNLTYDDWYNENAHSYKFLGDPELKDAFESALSCYKYDNNIK